MSLRSLTALQAVKQLDQLLDSSEQAEFVRNAVIRRLADSDTEVMNAVLCGAAIQTLPAAELASEVGSCLARSKSVISSEGENKAVRKAHRHVIRQVNIAAVIKSRECGLQVDILSARHLPCSQENRPVIHLLQALTGSRKSNQETRFGVSQSNK